MNSNTENLKTTQNDATVEEEKRQVETGPTATTKAPSRTAMVDESIHLPTFRSNQLYSANNTRSGPKLDFVGPGITNAPFHTTKNAAHATIEYAVPIPTKTNPTFKAESIDICLQDMEDCGMKPCEVFVPCALLEPLDDLELLVPGLIREEKQEQKGDTDTINQGKSPCGLKINESSCVVSNDIQECIQLVPFSLARVSNNLHLNLVMSSPGSKDNLTTYGKSTHQQDVNKNSSNDHIPQIEGYAVIQHKPINFAIHLYECPNDTTATVIEFQRRKGEVFGFQKFYDECLEQFTKTMKNLRCCNRNVLTTLPNLNSLLLSELQNETSFWDKDALDLLATLIDDESEEAVDMLGNLCDDLEKYISLRKEVLQHALLMEQMVTRVLTHQDQCFVSLGLIALYTSLCEEKVELIKKTLSSHRTLAFVIALLGSESVFVLRHAVRLLGLFANKCDAPWKINASQKQLLTDRLANVQHNLLHKESWVGTYATEAFVTKEMFQHIAQHPKI